MSNWAHVKAVFHLATVSNVHGVEDTPDKIERIFGKRLTFDGLIDKDTKYIPYGEESLRYTVHDDVFNKFAYDIHVVTFYGDLRGHDYSDKVIKWFKEIVENEDTVEDASMDIYTVYNGYQMIGIRNGKFIITTLDNDNNTDVKVEDINFKYS